MGANGEPGRLDGGCHLPASGFKTVVLAGNRHQGELSGKVAKGGDQPREIPDPLPAGKEKDGSPVREPQRLSQRATVASSGEGGGNRNSDGRDAGAR
jgi:hypothetical protein